MALLGLDPFRYLYSRDAEEIGIMSELHNCMLEAQQIQQENLATEIANKVSQLFK